MPTFDFPPKFQFSLRNLLIAVAVVAVLLGLLAVASGVLAWLLAIFVVWVVPTPVLVTAFYGRGDLRAFCIGAIVPWITLWSSHDFVGSLTTILWLLLRLIVMACICGTVAVATRRWVERDPIR